MKLLKIIILIVTLEFSLTLKLSSKSQDLLVNCIKLRDELGSEIDCMKIIKKEIARQKSLEDGENGNEMKNEFDSLEKDTTLYSFVISLQIPDRKSVV